MIGTRLSHYRLLERIGSGGMGVVYRARDEHLERDVAVKVLPAGALADDSARQRFRREAMALSRLSHPHIATVHDFDSQEGVDFLVMELVAGTPLDQRLKGGALPEAEVCGVGAQIAEALEAAHEQGIVHRDLKPSNVVLTAKGQVKVLDFGLARLLRPAEGLDLTKSLTESDVTVGTLPYMAPEQLLGRPVDARADLYALGVVLHELATGRSPYRETIPTALVYEIVNQSVPPPRKAMPQLSPRLEAVILNCLEKDPAARYASARALADDLRSGAPVARRGRRRARAVVIAAGLIALPALLVALDVGGVRGRLMGREHIESLVVLPLENLSRDPEQEYFVEGMTDELINNLAQIGALRVISRTTAMKYRGTHKGVPEIARELRVAAVLVGSVARAGGLVRINAELIRAADDRHLWAASYERDVGNVLTLQDELARAIAGEVRARLTPQERRRLTRARPVIPEAHEAYLRGRYYLNRWPTEESRKALDQFNQAIALDPGWANPYSGLGSAYTALATSFLPAREAMPRARAAALRAIALDSTLAEPHATLGYVEAFYDWHWKEGERRLRRAIELNPNDAGARSSLGALLGYRRHFDEAIAETQRARDLDPLSALVNYNALVSLNLARRYDQLIEAAHRVLQMDSTNTMPHHLLSQAYTQRGEYDKAIEAIHALSIPQDIGLVVIHARSGDRRLAERIFRQAIDRERTSPNPAQDEYWLATGYAALGEYDRAIEVLQRCLEARSEGLAYANVDPVMDPLRSDPRFQDIMRTVGLWP